MSSNDLKKTAIEIAKRLGKGEARRLLVVEGVSPHTADKIIGGRYQSEIGALVGAAIKRAFEASKVKAS